MKFIKLKDHSRHYFYINIYDIILIEHYDMDYSKIYLRGREYPLVAKELPEQIYDKIKSEQKGLYKWNTKK